MQDAACGVRVPGILAGANDTGQFLLAKSPAWWAQRIAWYPDGCFGPYRSAQEGYSRRELAVDGIVHLVGVLMGCVGAVLMLVRISDPACPAVVRAGLGVYACSLLAMLCCSAAFNLLVARWTTSTKALQLADHAGILLLIAGSYTPLMVVLCCGRTLAFVWTAGVVSFAAKASGSLLDLLGLHVLCFLSMGWACVASWADVSGALSAGALRGLLLGGSLYTAGLLPWAWNRREYHNAVWHVFVLAASAVFYWVIYTEVAMPSAFWHMGCASQPLPGP